MKTSIFQNGNKNIVLKLFVASLGLPWDLVSNIINKKTYRKPTGRPKKLPGSPKEAIKTVRAEFLTIFLLLFWKIDVLMNS